MSELIVPVAMIEEILPHPNAERLEIVRILGWQVVVAKGQFHINDRVTYFPPDSVLPLDVSNAFNVTKYLSKQRVRAIALRGEPSFGFIQPAPKWAEIGDNLAEHYHVEKYVAPFKPSSGDADKEDARFPRYTDIQNLRNFPDIFLDGEMVAVTEKIHGANVRVGYVGGEWMAGSHKYRRKETPNSLYWYPLSLDNVRDMLTEIANGSPDGLRDVILFGEVYGSVVQKDMPYGLNGKISFRAFDLMINGKYVDYQRFIDICYAYEIETVPVISVCPYSPSIVNLANGSTLVDETVKHIREGFVVRPTVESFHLRIGRVILKYVSDAYLLKEFTVTEMEDE